MKVVKFGGSSLASATQLGKVLNIVKSDSERKFVVVSAPGKKRSSGYQGNRCTNQILPSLC